MNAVQVDDLTYLLCCTSLLGQVSDFKWNWYYIDTSEKKLVMEQIQVESEEQYKLDRDNVNIYSLKNYENITKLLVVSNNSVSLLVLRSGIPGSWTTVPVDMDRFKNYPMRSAHIGMNYIVFIGAKATALFDGNTMTLDYLQDRTFEFGDRILTNAAAYCPVALDDDTVSDTVIIAQAGSSSKLRVNTIRKRFFEQSLHRDLQRIVEENIFTGEPFLSDLMINVVHNGELVAEFPVHKCIIQARAPELVTKNTIQANLFVAKQLISYIYFEKSFVTTNEQVLEYKSQNTLIEDLSTMMNREPDFYILYDGQTIGVHKLILCLASDFFLNSLQITEDDENSMNLDGLIMESYEVLHMAIEYMYTRKIDLNAIDLDTTVALLTLADFLALSSLMKLIEERFVSTITMDTVFDFYHYATSARALELCRKCEEYITANFFYIYVNKKELLDELDVKVVQRLRSQCKHKLEINEYDRNKVLKAPVTYVDGAPHDECVLPPFVGDVALGGSARMEKHVTIVPAEQGRIGVVKDLKPVLLLNNHGIDISFTVMFSKLLAPSNSPYVPLKFMLLEQDPTIEELIAQNTDHTGTIQITFSEDLYNITIELWVCGVYITSFHLSKWHMLHTAITVRLQMHYREKIVIAMILQNGVHTNHNAKNIARVVPEKPLTRAIVAVNKYHAAKKRLLSWELRTLEELGVCPVCQKSASACQFLFT
jgi:hypothetical protein